jgi:hypothetical protein
VADPAILSTEPLRPRRKPSESSATNREAPDMIVGLDLCADFALESLQSTSHLVVQHSLRVDDEM